MTSKMFSWTVIVICVAAITLSTTASVDKRFPSNRNGDQLTNMLVKNDRIFLAENGFLHVLDADLEHIQSFNTCVGDNCDNVIKVLTVFGDMLILCGTGNNGICQAWDGSTIKYSSSSDVSDDHYLTVSSDIKKTAVGLVHDGDFYFGVTKGQGVGKREIDDKTYNYFITRTKIDTGFSRVASVYLVDKVDQDYPVYFRKVFQNGRYIYFLTNQRKDLSSSNFVSKLIRICVDELYQSNQIKSYTDIVLSCEVDGINYNLLQDAEFLPARGILVAAFSKGVDPENPASDSAVCVYTMDAVNDAVLRAKEDFFTCSTRNSSDTTSAYFDINITQCLSKVQYETLKEDYICPSIPDHLHSGSNVIGYISPLQPDSNYKLKHNRITRVEGIDRYGLYPDVFIGTDKGSISKMTLDDSLKIFMYATDVVIDQGHSVTDIHVGEDKTYIVTNRKVSLVKNTECETYRSCMETMEYKNPSCGWCLVESRSTKKYDCSHGWMSSVSQCVSIDVSPKYISIHDIFKSNISITAHNVPNDVTTEMGCNYFDGSHQLGGSTEALPNGTNTYTCGLISKAEHRELTLQLVAYQNLRPLFIYAETNIQIYACNRHTACRKCLVSPEVNCIWCPTSLTCQSPESSCRIIVNDKSKCPRLEVTSDVYLPSGITKEIAIKAVHLVISNGVTYKCVIDQNGIKIQMPAVIVYNNIICSLNVEFDESDATIALPLFVFQKSGSSEVAIENNVTVTVYKCKNLATDCTMCRALKPNRYDCEWCLGGGCGHSSRCTNVVSCPLPQITKVDPPSGGYQGGTQLTITGTDFGTNTADISDVMVGDMRCSRIVVKQTNIPDLSTINKEIRCTVRRNYDIGVVGLRNVTFKLNTVQAGNGNYSFKNPIVSNIEPAFGPLIGGTLITLIGTDLDIDNQQPIVQLGLSSIINVVTLYNQSLTCKTPAITRTYTVMSVRLRWNVEFYDSTNILFRYLPTPNITKVSSGKSILSGGTRWISTGTHLANVAKTYVIVDYAGEKKTETCFASSDTSLECPSPPAPESVVRETNENLGQTSRRQKRSTQDESIKVQITIKMDGYEKTFPVEYFRDPELDMFRETIPVFKSEDRRLTISGNYLNLVGGTDDYKVSIGLGTCFVIEVTRTNLTCIPPRDSPNKSTEELDVVVQFGYFKKSVGYVRYTDTTVDTPEQHNIILILGPTVGGMLLVGIIEWLFGPFLSFAYHPFKSEIDDKVRYGSVLLQIQACKGKNTWDSETSNRKRAKDKARQAPVKAPGSEHQPNRRSDERTDYMELDGHQIRPVYQDLDVTALQTADRSVYQELGRDREHGQHVYTGLGRLG